MRDQARACCAGSLHLELYNPENLMRLDRAAQSALHVFPARTGARSSNSIYGLLNHSRTAMGKRLLRSWLKQPLTDVAAIQQRHNIVKVFVDDEALRCRSIWHSCSVHESHSPDSPRQSGL